MKWRTFHNTAPITLTLVLSVLAGALSAQITYAETPEHLTDRVLAEIEQQHPDVLSTCDPSVWTSREPFLFPLAKMLHQPIGRVACAFGNWKYRQGLEQAQLYGYSPTPYQWVYRYADDEEAFRSLFNVGHQVFAVNDWAERRYFRYSWQFCAEELKLGGACW